jgi:hypothetical protein
MDAIDRPLANAAVTSHAPDHGASQACAAGSAIHADAKMAPKLASFIERSPAIANNEVRQVTQKAPILRRQQKRFSSPE